MVRWLLIMLKLVQSILLYNAQWFDSDTTSLEVFEESGKIAFNASNLKSHIDVSMQEGFFYQMRMSC